MQNTTKPNIEIKKIEAGGDYNRFSKLFRSCFRQEKSTQYFQWKYFDNPAGSIVGYEAIAKGKTVASYGLIPEYYYVNGKKIKIYQAADAMVSPRYWGKNLFNQIAQRIQQEVMEADNHTFMIAYPGILSRNELLNNLDWEMVKADCRYIFLQKKYHQFTNLFRLSSKVQVQVYQQMQPDLRTYLSNYTPPSTISKCFEPEIFQWKIFDRIDVNYTVLGIKEEDKLLGICIYRKDTDKTCELCWLNFQEKSNYKYTAKFANTIFKQERVKYIHTWKPLDTSLDKALKKVGFLTNTLSKGPFNYTFPYLVYIKASTFAGNTSQFDGNEFYPIFLD